MQNLPMVSAYGNLRHPFFKIMTINIWLLLFWSFWRSMYDHSDFAYLLDWWDQGKFYLQKVSRCYSNANAVREQSHKTALTKQMHTLQCLFEREDQSAFTQLIEVQQLRTIALHEVKGAKV